MCAEVDAEVYIAHCVCPLYIFSPHQGVKGGVLIGVHEPGFLLQDILFAIHHPQHRYVTA